MASKHKKAPPEPAPSAVATHHLPPRSLSAETLSAWEEVQRQLDAQSPEPAPEDQGYAEFELDFEQALARQLGPFFEKLQAAALTPENILHLVKPDAKGAYYLLLEGVVVYIGKSDAKDGLRVRLLRHHKTLKRRRNIDWEDMKFKAVKVSSLAALDTESLLLDIYKKKAMLLGQSTRPEWNFSGFGSNDTGVERDTQRVSLFDQRYPLDLNARIELDGTFTDDHRVPLDEYLKWLATQFKFVFRRQSKGIPAQKSLGKVAVKPAAMIADDSLRGLLLAVRAKLPEGWVLTVLRGKVVLYLNDRREYKSPLWRLEVGQRPLAPDYTLRDVGDAQDEDLGA